MKNEIVIDGIVYVKKGMEDKGEPMFIASVMPEYLACGSSFLNLCLTQTEGYQVIPTTKFKPGMTIRIIIEANP